VVDKDNTADRRKIVPDKSRRRERQLEQCKLFVPLAANTEMDRPDFPTMEQVEKADREQLARWYRFLPSGDQLEQRKIRHRLAERFQKMGGMTSELSKKIGFGGD
jgi:hypothetical protein